MGTSRIIVSGLSLTLTLALASGCAPAEDGIAAAAPGGDGAVVLPEHTDVPTLPDGLRGLAVRATTHVVGGTLLAEAPGAAQKECLDHARTFLEHIGWRVVEDGTADLEVDMACTGHVTLLDTPTALQIVLPANAGPSITLRANGAVVDTIPRGPNTLRCDLPASADRTPTCAARASEWTSGRLEGLSAASAPLAAFAHTKHL